MSHDGQYSSDEMLDLIGVDPRVNALVINGETVFQGQGGKIIFETRFETSQLLKMVVCAMGKGSSGYGAKSSSGKGRGLEEGDVEEEVDSGLTRCYLYRKVDLERMYEFNMTLDHFLVSSFELKSQ